MNLVPFLCIPVFAICNRARGSKLFDHTTSTTIGRLLSTAGMALVTAYAASTDIVNIAEIFAWTWATLMLWAAPAWDNYWSAAIGNPTDINDKAFKPVDWIMSKLPITNIRIWGTVAMGLRQSLAMPCIIGVAFLTGHPPAALYAPLTLLFGIPYLIAGYFKTKYDPIAVAEYLVGAALGLLIINTI